MPYVKRDEAGQIVSVSLSRESDDQEFLDAESAQLAAFFEDARASADSLRESDTDSGAGTGGSDRDAHGQGHYLVHRTAGIGPAENPAAQTPSKRSHEFAGSIGRGLKQPHPSNPFPARRHSWCLPPASQTAWWWAPARARYATRPWG